ncbi:MobA/MobL family protein [Lactiplantibacillus plantarum]|uniref:MobA/MobL family protein n=1 Tax=Lactiplantibacillus plantarum TaxID=1590 RepID=UPI00404569A0
MNRKRIQRKYISAGKGRSAIASAAYRSGEKLFDDKEGHHYFYARSVMPESFILTPKNAPAWASNREQLWNEVEKKDRKSNSRYAKEFNVALPIELSLYLRIAGARGHQQVVGTPQSVADQLQQWFEQDGADGFNIMSPWLPGGLDDFIELALPELRRRGLFRSEYEGATLRQHLGLARPPHRATVSDTWAADQPLAPSPT